MFVSTSFALTNFQIEKTISDEKLSIDEKAAWMEDNVISKLNVTEQIKVQLMFKSYLKADFQNQYRLLHELTLRLAQYEIDLLSVASYEVNFSKQTIGNHR